MASSITVSSSGSDIVIHEILDSQGLDHIFTIACSDCATAMAEDQNVLVVYESSLALMTIYDADAIECGTTILAITTDINALIAACPGGGGGSQTLAQTLVLGNATGGENILVNDADAIELENTSLLKQGTYDFGGDGGISRICSVGFEDMWQSGIRHVFDNNGFIRNSTNCFNLIPDSSYDNTLRFKVGSIWTLDNGTTYVCNDASTGAAVWVLLNFNFLPFADILLATAQAYTYTDWTPLINTLVGTGGGPNAFFSNVLFFGGSYGQFNPIGVCYFNITDQGGAGPFDYRNYFEAHYDLQNDVIVSVKNAYWDIRSNPAAVLDMLRVCINNTGNVDLFTGVTIGINCTINIDPNCKKMNGVTIGDNNTVTCDSGSRLLNISIDNGVDPIVFPGSNGQTNDAWSGHISKYDSDVDVIFPTLGFGDTDIDLTNYASFGGIFYVQPYSSGNDIYVISNGQYKRNYKIINNGANNVSEILNFATGGNLECNTFFIGLPVTCTNANGHGIKDNITIQYDPTGRVAIKSAEVY